ALTQQRDDPCNGLISVSLSLQKQTHRLSCWKKYKHRRDANYRLRVCPARARYRGRPASKVLSVASSAIAQAHPVQVARRNAFSWLIECDPRNVICSRPKRITNKTD
ncbi:hypothetical protein, partial [Ralstonia solanacearum]|uniref:hypothetical protein n=1 Tax=Ralstonia solanacearum TaxID=305 RepID=UPI00202A3CB0